jgi:hypothetical protein
MVTVGGTAAGGVSCDGSALGDVEDTMDGVLPDAAGTGGALRGAGPADDVPPERVEHAPTVTASTAVTATAAMRTDDGECGIEPPIDLAAWRRWQPGS